MPFYFPAGVVAINYDTRYKVNFSSIFTGFMFLLLIGAGILLFGKAPQTQSTDTLSEGWRYGDITFINPQAGTNENLIAAYARKNGTGIQIRLDYLNLKASPTTYIKISTGIDGHIFPLQYTILCRYEQEDCRINTVYQPSTGENPQLSVLYDKSMDSLYLEIAGPFLTRHADKLNIQVDTEQNDTQSAPFALFASKNAARVNLMMTFWNTLPAASPVQLMRRWDGAHTGPFGQRHGLKQLLENASGSHIPVFLLDLKQPQQLAALAYLHHLDDLSQWAAEGTAILADIYPAGTNKLIQSDLSEGGQLWQIPPTNVAYAPLLPFPANNAYAVVFKPSDKNDLTMQAFAGGRLIDFPENTDGMYAELDRFGLTLPGKQQLSAALQDNANNHLLLWGGNLSLSAWGDSMAGPRGLLYIQQHPWINPLDVYELTTLPVATMAVAPSFASLPQTDCSKKLPGPFDQNAAYQALVCAPPNAITALAWNEYTQLTAEPATMQEKALRAHYFVNIERLILASNWLQKPQVVNQAVEGINNNAYYLLSDGSHLLILDPRGARLILAVSLTPEGISEWIAPTSQFAIGLGAPDDWTDSGEESDPQVIAGAFVDKGFEDRLYSSTALQDGVLFSSAQTEISKSYQLSNNKLTVEYHTPLNLQTAIPFAFEPVEFLRNAMLPTLEQDGLAPQNIYPITYRGGIDITSPLHWYFESYQSMQSSEDPDKDYPTGHYYPFPVGLIKLQILAVSDAAITFDLSALTHRNY